MDEQIKQITERLRGLRDALELSRKELADSCHISEREYEDIEEGRADFSVSLLQKVARKYGIPLDTLMFGEEPKMSSYFITRVCKGISVERSKAYKYQSLASGFLGRKMDAFLVMVEPSAEGEKIKPNSHPGQEFNIVAEGRMLLNIDGKELLLNTGDSIYFNSALPHYMIALDGKPVKFLAVIC